MSENMQSETIGKLALALSKAQSEMNGVAKGADNPFFKSKYADLHSCISAAQGPLTNNELCVFQTTEPAENGLVVITTLAHSSGEWVRGRLLMKPKKDDDQGRGSSITYARRYAYAAIVGLAQKDDDGNGSCGKRHGKDKPEKQYDGSKYEAINAFTANADKAATSQEALAKWFVAAEKSDKFKNMTDADKQTAESYVAQLSEAMAENG